LLAFCSLDAPRIRLCHRGRAARKTPAFPKRSWSGACKKCLCLFEAGQPTNVVAAGHLHDTPEDVRNADHSPIHPYTVGGIQEIFGDDIAILVDEVTNVFTSWAFPHLTRKQRHVAETARLAGISPSAQTIKYADIISNTRNIEEQDADFAKVYKREKLAILEVMAAGDKTLYRRALESVNA
jgi:(p)ppGpp synthase/HD superfamily hydrolase